MGCMKGCKLAGFSVKRLMNLMTEDRDVRLRDLQHLGRIGLR
jgi:hypothetical protein